MGTVGVLRVEMLFGLRGRGAGQILGQFCVSGGVTETK